MGVFYIYADESCHTKSPSNTSMALVATFCKADHRTLISKIIKKIMSTYNINPDSELKWTKVSRSNVEMYMRIITFIAEVAKYGDIGIRALSITGKDKITGNYDEWYHKMYYILFEKIFDQHIYRNYSIFHILVDYKDKYTYKNIDKVGNYLKSYSRGSADVITTAANSKEHMLIQISDVIAGSITYYNRGLKTSAAKVELIKHIFNTFDINYDKNTPIDRSDFNLFKWSAR